MRQNTGSWSVQLLKTSYASKTQDLEEELRIEMRNKLWHFLEKPMYLLWKGRGKNCDSEITLFWNNKEYLFIFFPCHGKRKVRNISFQEA